MLIQHCQSNENTDSADSQKTALLLGGKLRADSLIEHLLEYLGYRILELREDQTIDPEQFAVDKPGIAILSDAANGSNTSDHIERLRGIYNIPILYIVSSGITVPGHDRTLFNCDDFILKPFTPEELDYRIQCLKMRYAQKKLQRNVRPLVDRRKKVPDKTKIPAKEPYFHIDKASRLVFIENKPVHLTPKEYSLFCLLASEPGRVYSNKEIIEQIWNSDNQATAKDVQQYVYHLRKKLEKDPSQPCFLHNVPGYGYKLDQPEE
ncbi:MAG: winged helix-turn-helix domain-containing protein [Gammaproteobacteria bacterium]